MKKINLVLLILLTTSLVTCQEYKIDISGISNEEYTPGTEMKFKIILLENGTQIDKEVEYKIFDNLYRKEINGTSMTNKEIIVNIENNFLSGIWTISTNYLDTKVERTFSIGESPGVEFLIEKDELIIRNTGNVPYQKTIQIQIGSETNSYAQNIRVGEEKILKLISKEGTYDIKITDGKSTIKKENVQLFGTGNVVGAIDKNLVGYTGFVGVDDLTKSEDRIIYLDKLPISLIFIGLIGILAALVFVERKIRKKN
jgi:hypothetical protein